MCFTSNAFRGRGRLLAQVGILRSSATARCLGRIYAPDAQSLKENFNILGLEPAGVGQSEFAELVEGIRRGFSMARHRICPESSRASLRGMESPGLNLSTSKFEEGR
jgi:hypothetical protein